MRPLAEMMVASHKRLIDVNHTFLSLISRSIYFLYNDIPLAF